MRKTASSRIVWLVVALSTFLVGCPGPGEKPGGSPDGSNGGETPGVSSPQPAGDDVPSAQPEEAATSTQSPGTMEAAPEELPAEPATEKTPVDASIPQVQLPEMLTATCLVGVGDRMPDAPMDVLGGEQAPLRSQFGPRLTVMLFWASDNLYACDELRDLTGDVAEPYAEDGLRVIGINVSDSAEAAAHAVAAAEAGFPNFLDPKGEYFAKVASEKLPRTYLLGPDGTILWFDLEYSLTTRRQLKRAVEAALRSVAQQPAQATEAGETKPDPVEDEAPPPETAGQGPTPLAEEPATTEGGDGEPQLVAPQADAPAPPGDEQP